MSKKLDELDDHSLLTNAYRASYMGSHQEAIKYFLVVLKRDAGNPFVRLAVANSYHAMGQVKKANLQLSRVSEFAKKDPALLLPLSEAYFSLRESELALKTARRAERHAEFRATALQLQMEINEKINRLDEAELVMQKAKSEKQTMGLMFSTARILQRTSRTEEAVELLNRIIKSPETTETLLGASHYLLANTLNQQGKAELAMQHLEKAKQSLRNNQGNSLLKALQVNTFKLLTPSEGSEPMPWNNMEVSKSSHRHVFLVGHPRSGTTLLEQSLDAHDSIVSADETSIFSNAVQTNWQSELTAMEQQGVIEKLAAVEPGVIHKYRNAYFSQMKNYLGKEAQASVWVDKNPALIQSTILIDRLFPDGKLIVSLRDPRDVILSSYMQHLDLTAWSVNWLSLDTAVNQYCEAMGIWLKLKGRTAMDWIEVRYEDMVVDLTKEAKRVTEFLELPWQPQQSDIQTHVKKKEVYSPTYADVSKPIYDSSVAKWRKYSDFFEPYQDQLAPFVEAFGYDA